MKNFLLSFIPIFVAMDAIGTPLVTGPAVLTTIMMMRKGLECLKI